jgi:tetratricopeptide (TPR) repeat protein
MADGTPKPVIFISYSHKDEPERTPEGDIHWLNEIQSYLAPAANGTFELWNDEDMAGGADWEKEIKAKLAVCDICILFVSRHSLASKYAIEVEIATILERQKNGHNVQIYPIVLSPFPEAAVPASLLALNWRPRLDKPLSGFSRHQRGVEISKIADEIVRLLGRKPTTAAPPTTKRLKPPSYVHITGLPETGYEHLVGRETELQNLGDAWADSKTNILSLVAEGGAGKSALVNEWLKRMQVDNYRGAEVVLGWSFYSQGTKERATSADEFLNWALDKLDIKLESTSATFKGEAIAEALMRRRVLLLLDGVEPLQRGLDTQLGQLKDQGLRALLRRLAAIPPAQVTGLVVLTSRLAVKDIALWRDGVAPVIDIEQLTDEAGAALLRDNGVWGTDKELKAATHDFGGHPLALGLLASFLRETQFGDVRRRDHIRAYLTDPENPRHDHAKRVMESIENEWLVGQPILLSIMQIVGLFDRPANRRGLYALRKVPVIEGLTNKIVNLDDKHWQRAISRLREARLLAPIDLLEPGSLDAHPLVREWFGERLRRINNEAWMIAHGRLYEHLRDTTKEGKAPTIEDLSPLYQAIAHGCQAGKDKEALHDIYEARICRNVHGAPVYYASATLCAFGSNLAAISWFFKEAYTRLPSNWSDTDKSWVFNEAATGLAAQGRFQEALPPQRAAVQLSEAMKAWMNAAINASNLSDAELIVGHIVEAVDVGLRAISYSDRSPRYITPVGTRGVTAHALHALGRPDKAEQLFIEAEEIQKSYQPDFPLSYSKQGYHYCDFLLSRGKTYEVLERTARTIEWAQKSKFPRDVALDLLTLGRANLAQALEKMEKPEAKTIACNLTNLAVDQLDRAIEGLRGADEVRYLADGMLARAAFHRSRGSWNDAARDLSEVQEIAEPGPMRLHLCDLAIERARLAMAQIEAYAPLDCMPEKDIPLNPTVPSAEQIAELKDEAGKQINIAAEYIEKYGYHRRDEESVELQGILRGEKKFADLPPRV